MIAMCQWANWDAVDCLPTFHLWLIFTACKKLRRYLTFMGPCIVNIYIYIYIYIQQDAMLHSLFISGNCSTCFGWYLHPPSGAHKTLSIASGICHAVIFRYFLLTLLLQYWIIIIIIIIIIILVDTVLILTLSDGVRYVTYIFHGVSVGWSGFADNPDHRILQMTEELFGLCLFHELRVSKFSLAF
jgi:hypothetical protein